jgi:hypothetical protein
MTLFEILNALELLTQEERRLLCRRMLEFACEVEDINLCNQSALEGAKLLESIEDGLENKHSV